MLPDSCLVRLVCDCSAPRQPNAPEVLGNSQANDGEQYLYREGGHGFIVRFEGREPFAIPFSNGSRMLRLLLQSQGTSIAATQLEFQLSGNPANLDCSQGEEVADQQALNAYGEQYRELKSDLEDAKEAENWKEVERLEEQVREFAKHISSVTGLNGRSRKAPSPGERARKRVYNAIRSVKKLVPEEFREHLNRFLSTGSSLCYSPDEAIGWQF